MTDRGLDSVLLDVDGTLVDSTYQHALAWHRAFAAHDLSIPMWRLHRVIGMGGDRLVAAVAGDAGESGLGDALREGWKQEYEKLLPEVTAFDRASALLTELKRRGWRVALASSGKPDHTRVAIDLLGGDGPLDGWTSAGATHVFDDVAELLDNLDQTPLVRPITS